MIRTAVLAIAACAALPPIGASCHASQNKVVHWLKAWRYDHTSLAPQTIVVDSVDTRKYSFILEGLVPQRETLASM
jgi:hypothetical protein